MKLEFGMNCKDIITGFEGILNSRVAHITGCDRVALVNDKQEEKWFSTATVDIVDLGVSANLKKREGCNSFSDLDDANFDFGVSLRDCIGNYEGKAVAKSISVSGDISYGLSPKHDRDKKDNDGEWFDEGRLVINEAKEKTEVKTNNKRVGGVANPGLRVK